MAALASSPPVVSNSKWLTGGPAGQPSSLASDAARTSSRLHDDICGIEGTKGAIPAATYSSMAGDAKAAGCIAVRNHEIEEIYGMVNGGIPIIIKG